MKNNPFFKTYEGELTIAFIVILVTFLIMTISLKANNVGLSEAGLVITLLAILYSPFRKFVLNKNTKNAK
ncbi:MAG: hypothetical protein VB064_08315 [Oscillospiraceae bacterium]|nr:hypothetical protein [Oscillospiraceae bacterium]